MTDKTTAPTSAELAELLVECKRFLEDMHAMPVDWTIRESQVLHAKLAAAATIESQRQVIAGPKGWIVESSHDTDFTNDAAIAAYWKRKGRNVQRLHAIPAGYQIVPCAPTEAMMHAAEDVAAPRQYGEVYRAMLNAAPVAPHQESAAP